MHITTYVYTVEFVAYDFIMDDKADFDAFIAHISEGKYAYAMLSANIDYKGALISHNSQSDVSPAVRFYLDGEGHSVSNVSIAAKRGLFGDTGNDIVLKNIAIVDLDGQAGNTAGGLFVELSNATLSNVYVNMSMYLVTGAPIALGANANVKVENVVTHVTEVGGDPNSVFGSTTWDQTTPHGGLTTLGAYNNSAIYKNCYSIHPWASVMTRGTSKVEDDKEVSDNPLAYTEGLYKSLDAFKAAVTTLPEGFSADLWKINMRGGTCFERCGSS